MAADQGDISYVACLRTDAGETEGNVDPHEEQVKLQRLLESSTAEGDLVAVKQCLDRGANPNYKFKSGSYAESDSNLCLAIQRGHNAIAKLLLEKGANRSFQETQKALVHDPYAPFRESLHLLMYDSMGAWTRGSFTMTGAILEGIVPDIAKGLAEVLINFAKSNQKSHLLPLVVVENDGQSIIKAILGDAVDEEFVVFLLDNGLFSEKQFTREGETRNRSLEALFFWACQRGRIQVIKKFLSLGMSVNQPVAAQGSITRHHPLWVATAYGNHETIKTLLENGADVHASIESSESSRSGTEEEQPILALLTRYSRRPLLSLDTTLSLLLEHGANVNACDSSSRTVVSIAAADAKPATVDLLLAHKADPNIPDTFGRIPLHYIANNLGAAALAQSLAPKTRNIDHQDNSGNTPLIDLVRSGVNTEATRILLAHGANVLYSSPEKGTALQNSTWWANLELFKVLLDAGSDPNACSGKANKPPLMAVASAYARGPQLIQFLLEHGARADYADADGKTALHEVIETGAHNAAKSARILLKHGAKPRAKWRIPHGSGKPVTPLRLALGGHYGSNLYSSTPSSEKKQSELIQLLKTWDPKHQEQDDYLSLSDSDTERSEDTVTQRAQIKRRDSQQDWLAEIVEPIGPGSGGNGNGDRSTVTVTSDPRKSSSPHPKKRRNHPAVQAGWTQP